MATSDKMSGMVDPETIYTKQNCIGMFMFLACDWESSN